MDKFTKEQQVQAVYDLKVGYTLGHADIAMLKSMARQLLASMEQEPVAYMHHSGQVVTREECCDDEIFAICCKVETPLYAAPQLPQPAVLSVSEGVLKSLLPDVEKSEFWFEHNGKIFFEGVRFNNAVFEACRAAMLQAGNHTEQHLDMVDRSGDTNEKADCRLPFDQWLSQQNETIDVDCGCVTTEAFYHWLRVAYEAGNSTATPDDVLRMDWLVSKTVDVREPMVYGSHSIFWSQTITDEDDDYHATKLREQIDAAMAAEQAAAPQQEDL